MSFYGYQQYTEASKRVIELTLVLIKLPHQHIVVQLPHQSEPLPWPWYEPTFPCCRPRLL